jgi:XTP/dITP diphosphohydrolase
VFLYFPSCYIDIGLSFVKELKMPRTFTEQTLVLATHNQKKIDEMRGFLSPRVARVLTARDLYLPEPAETGITFLENATIKAMAAARAVKMPVLAEDSGLCVKALGGAPGVYTADWAGHPRNFRAAMHRVLIELEFGPSGLARGPLDDSGAPGIRRGTMPCVDRSAYFQTTIVLAWPDGHVEVFVGQIDGTIAPTMRGTGGFGYDPIFIPDGHAKTFAEMGAQEKIAISHRTRAVRAMLEQCFK